MGKRGLVLAMLVILLAGALLLVPSAQAALPDGTCIWIAMDFFCDVNNYPVCGSGYHMIGSYCQQNWGYTGPKIDGAAAPCTGGYNCCQDQKWCKDTDRDNYPVAGCAANAPGTYVINCAGDAQPIGYIVSSWPEDCNDNDMNTNPGITGSDMASSYYHCGTADYNCDGTIDPCYNSRECMSDCSHGNFAMYAGSSYFICTDADKSLGYHWPCSCQGGYREAYFDSTQWGYPLAAGLPVNDNPPVPEVSARESFRSLLLNPPLAQEVMLKNPFVYPPYLWSCFPACSTWGGTCAYSSPMGDVGAAGKVNGNCLSGPQPGTPTACYDFYCAQDFGSGNQCYNNAGCTDNSMCNTGSGYTCRTSNVGSSEGTKLAGWCYVGQGGACANYNNCGGDNWCSAGHCCPTGQTWNGASCTPGQSVCSCSYSPITSANYLNSACVDRNNRQSCLSYTNSYYGPGQWWYTYPYTPVYI